MKKIFIILLALLLAVSLSSCDRTSGIVKTITATAPDGTVTTTLVEGYTDTMAYHENVMEHQKFEAARIQAQAEAVALIDTGGLSKDAQALLAVQQISAISGLKPLPYGGKAPVTGWDVANTLADHTRDIVTGTIAWKGLDVLGQAVANAGDKTNTTVGDGSSASGFNTTKTNQQVSTTSEDDAVTQFQPANGANPSSQATNDDPQTTTTTTTIGAATE